MGAGQQPECLSGRCGHHAQQPDRGGGECGGCCCRSKCHWTRNSAGHHVVGFDELTLTVTLSNPPRQQRPRRHWSSNTIRRSSRCEREGAVTVQQHRHQRQRQHRAHGPRRNHRGHRQVTFGGTIRLQDLTTGTAEIARHPRLQHGAGDGITLAGNITPVNLQEDVLSLEKIGTGRITLGGNDGYTGLTTITEGFLRIRRFRARKCGRRNHCRGQRRPRTDRWHHSDRRSADPQRDLLGRGGARQRRWDKAPQRPDHPHGRVAHPLPPPELDNHRTDPAAGGQSAQTGDRDQQRISVSNTM